ncbi:hypothetical protein CM15mP43_11060 [bacterium]|nr:MAG: hypothetical protein CM15mP43_11060 [bacterium]
MEKLLNGFERLCFDKNLIKIKNKLISEERLDFNDAKAIMETQDINSLGILSSSVKEKMHGKKVYFVVNRHINPSNVCAISCKFLCIW